ncbi:hypothetical protein, partial [Xanthovirga aplysinae]|uniref:hypothetical protein n=1 Tax=Xanthovirga aplysinae TaxID=2529853 RepID=UPI0016571465
SNIIFRTNNSYINGVIHFIDFENAQVFATIYHNLNVFERSLREYLAFNGLNDTIYLDYLKNYKRNKKGSEDWAEKRIEALEFKKLIDENRKPFENLYLNELMEFSLSSYHKENSNQKLDLSFLKEKVLINKGNKPRFQLINQLRNYIMHHHDISGESSENLHNFSHFQTFYRLVLNLKETFSFLAKRTIKMERARANGLNNKRLQFISAMDKTEIRDYFYKLI